MLRGAVEAGAHVRQRIAAFPGSRADADRGKRSEQTAKCLFICTGCLGELAKRLRSVPQQLAEPESGGDIDHRRHTVRLDQIEKPEGWYLRCHRASFCLGCYRSPASLPNAALN